MPTWFSKKPSDVPTVEAGPGVSARPEHAPLPTSTSLATAMPPSPQDVEADRQRLAEYNSFASLNRRLKDCCFDFQISAEEFSTCLKFYQAQEAKRQATASSPGYSLVDIAVIREAKRRVREEQKLPPTAHVADQDIGIMTGKLRQEANWRTLCGQAEKKSVAVTTYRRTNQSSDQTLKSWLSNCSKSKARKSSLFKLRHHHSHPKHLDLDNHRTLTANQRPFHLPLDKSNGCAIIKLFWQP